MFGNLLVGNAFAGFFGLAALFTALSVNAAVSVTAGGDHSCLVTSSGGVKCWGHDGFGQLGDGLIGPNRSTPADVAGVGGVVSVSAGANHTCALTAAGGVKCWGHDTYGQLGDGVIGPHRATAADVPTLTSGVKAVVAGGNHTCALTETGGVKCWGRDIDGLLGDGVVGPNRPTPADVVGLTSGVVAISANYYHTCAATTQGLVKCWGANFDGQLGVAIGPASPTPVEVAGLSGVVSVALGETHSCALTTSGGVKCWGADANGQLGDGTSGTPGQAAPTDVIGLSSGVTGFSAGGYSTCALRTGGSVSCWGQDTFGNLGDGVIGPDRSLPADALTDDVIAIDSGDNHSCVVRSDASVQCWGKDEFGQLGDGSSGTPRATPADVIIPELMVTAGGDHSCLVTSSGGVKCWGHDGFGQLGDGLIGPNRSTPADVAGVGGVVSVSAGANHACALTAAGGVKCWGHDTFGQLGDGVIGPDRATAADVPTLTSGVKAVVTGGNHTCALTEAGGVKCWGRDIDGLLGDGVVGPNRPTPADVVGLTTGIIAISANYYHTCAATTQGLVKCWGANFDGQLGAAIGPGSPTPVQVVGLSGVVSVAVGNAHSCALTTSGSVKCWGADANGQLGDGTSGTPGQATPTDVIGLSGGVTSLSAGGSSTCALHTGGSVSCWGQDTFGNLGDGVIGPDRSMPADVLTDNVIAIDSGDNHSCVVRSDASVQCWGLDEFGQLGDGSIGTPRATPSDVIGFESSTILQDGFEGLAPP